MNKQKKVNLYFFMSCTIGLLLSCYSLFVEIKAEENKDYKAYCDINEYISCTKAFSSKYGKGFGIIESVFGQQSILNQPNSLIGIFFYLILGFMCYSEKKPVIKLLMVLCIISNLFSIYLAYILYFVLHDFCMICVGTYMVNAVNLGLSITKWKNIKFWNGDSISKDMKKYK